MATDESAAPLSAAELAQIGESWQRADAEAAARHEVSGSLVTIARLLATIAARDAAVAAYREIVAAMADTDMIETYRRGLHVDDGYWDQLRSRARALLAGEAGDTTAAAGDK